MIAGRDDLIPIEYDPESNRTEWLLRRQKGIGGSDIAAILGEHQTRKAIDVWMDKTAALSADDGNERTEMGNILEPIISDLFAHGAPKWPRSGGKYVVVKPPSVYHRDRTWQRGSADGFVYLPEAVLDIAVELEPIPVGLYQQTPEVLCRRAPSALLEIKTHGWYGSKGYSLNDVTNPIVSVPPDKRIQCAWYMGLYGVGIANLACLVDTHLRRTFTLLRDTELEAMLLDAAERFWTSHVLADIPPEPDGSDSYRSYLSGRYDKHSDYIIGASDEVELAVESLIAIKRDQKRLEDEREMAEQVIKVAIGDNEGVQTSLGKVTWKSRPSGKIRQHDALAELYSVAGWTDDEISSFEERHKQPDNRVLRTPK